MSGLKIFYTYEQKIIQDLEVGYFFLTSGTQFHTRIGINYLRNFIQIAFQAQTLYALKCSLRSLSYFIAWQII